MHILLGIVFGVIVFFCSFMFWGIGKKNKFLHNKMVDRAFLSEFLHFEHNRRPFSERTAHLLPMGQSYALNMEIALKSTIDADIRLRVIGILGAIVAIGASALIGNTYALINVALFLSAALVPIGEPGARNALKSILEVALILHKWNAENHGECYEFSREATSLQKLYDAVILLYDRGRVDNIQSGHSKETKGSDVCATRVSVPGTGATRGNTRDGPTDMRCPECSKPMVKIASPNCWGCKECMVFVDDKGMPIPNPLGKSPFNFL